MTDEQYKGSLPIWGSCVFVGNFVGNKLSGFMLKQGLAWRSIIAGQAIICGSILFLVFIVGPNDHPANTKIVTLRDHSNDEEKDLKPLSKKESIALTTWEIMTQVPSAIWLAFGYFCVKGARYWFYRALI